MELGNVLWTENAFVDRRGFQWAGSLWLQYLVCVDDVRRVSLKVSWVKDFVLVYLFWAWKLLRLILQCSHSHLDIKSSFRAQAGETNFLYSKLWWWCETKYILGLTYVFIARFCWLKVLSLRRCWSLKKIKLSRQKGSDLEVRWKRIQSSALPITPEANLMIDSKQ